MSEHTPTPTPWRTSTEFKHMFGFECVLIEAGSTVPEESICVAAAWADGTEDHEALANARRIVDCVNALAGLDPAKLHELERACQVASHAVNQSDPNLWGEALVGVAQALAAFRKKTL